jgi:hypothetical protein
MEALRDDRDGGLVAGGMDEGYYFECGFLVDLLRGHRECHGFRDLDFDHVGLIALL